MAKQAGIEAVKNSLDNAIPYHTWQHKLADSLTALNNIKNDELALKFINQITQQEKAENQKLGSMLRQATAIGSVAGNTMGNIQKPEHSHPTMQKNSNLKINLTLPDAQKTLARVEREIY